MWEDDDDDDVKSKVLKIIDCCNVRRAEKKEDSIRSLILLFYYSIIFDASDRYRFQFFIFARKWTGALSWTKQSERAHSVSEKVEKTVIKFFSPEPYMVQGWFVCLSVCVCLGKSWITFERMDRFGWNFQWLSRLVVANLVVGSTCAKSPPVTTWPASSPFSCSLSPLWSWVLPGRVIPFWKT